MEINEKASSFRSFWLGKLFSLAGIIPLGVYVVVHLYQNLRGLSGAEAFDQHLASSRSLPFIVPVTILVIWIPIAFHGLYGLFAMKKARSNFIQLPHFENFKYVVQRLSGIGLLLFIPAHIYKTRIEPTLAGTPLNFHHMVEGMHEPLTFGVYILGVLGVAFHLANGVWQFSIGWGITTSQKGMRRMQTISFIFFSVLLAMGYGAIFGFYR